LHLPEEATACYKCDINNVALGLLLLRRITFLNKW